MRSSARPSCSPDRRALSGVDERAPATSSYWSSRREAMRWTAPMKAPSPPPTMPSLILPPLLASLRPSMAMGLLSPCAALAESAVHRASGRTPVYRPAMDRVFQMRWNCSAQSECALDLLLVDLAAGEIVERLVGDADDVMLDEV